MVATAVSEALLHPHLERARSVIASNGGDPQADLWLVGLWLFVRIRARADGAADEDVYVFGLHYLDFDEHAPRVTLREPETPDRELTDLNRFPELNGNNTLSRLDFFCMPGDRRCYERGSHTEWMHKKHYVPDAIIAGLFGLLHGPLYMGRRDRAR